MKILVVDDDAISLMALVDVINACGDFGIVEAKDATEALNSINGKGVPPMLVCCDIRMPGMSGIELLEIVRREPSTKDLPFVLISMANDAETIKEAIKIGVSGYIVKPFSLDDAKNRLERVLLLASSRIMEKPESTMVRLKLSADRYRGYLEGMQRQADNLILETAATASDRDLVEIRQKMTALHSACITLGLWRGASLLKTFAGESALRTDMIESLKDVARQLRYQAQAIPPLSGG